MVQLQSLEWVQGLALVYYVTDHLNNLNRMLQSRNQVVTRYYANIRAFTYKLALWEMKLSNNNPAHLPYLRVLYSAGSADDLSQKNEKIFSLP